MVDCRKAEFYSSTFRCSSIQFLVLCAPFALTNNLIRPAVTAGRQRLFLFFMLLFADREASRGMSFCFPPSLCGLRNGNLQLPRGGGGGGERN